jgi:hypothetical protein
MTKRAQEPGEFSDEALDALIGETRTPRRWRRCSGS